MNDVEVGVEEIEVESDCIGDITFKIPKGCTELELCADDLINFLVRTSKSTRGTGLFF